jgi:hypothetical protein
MSVSVLGRPAPPPDLAVPYGPLAARRRPEAARASSGAADRAHSRRILAAPGGKLAEIPGAGHFDVIDPQSEAWPMVLAALAGTFP